MILIVGIEIRILIQLRNKFGSAQLVYLKLYLISQRIFNIYFSFARLEVNYLILYIEIKLINLIFIVSLLDIDFLSRKVKLAFKN